MNKKFITILIILAAALIAFNVTIVDFQNPLKGDSGIAVIGVVASLCAIALLLIFVSSKKIQDNLNKD